MTDPMMEEAADWADRLDTMSTGERDALGQWLRRSPDHHAALARMVRLLGDPALFDLVEAAQSKAIPPLPPVMPPRDGSRRWSSPPRLSRRRIAIGLVAGLAAIVAVPPLWRLTAPGDAVTQAYASAIGQPRAIALPDGSAMALDAASRVTIAFSDDARALDLQQGAARFEVRHDAARPFAVSTPEGRMTALGTNFSVDRGPGQSELRVFRGRVRLDVAGLPPTVVTAGQWAEARPGHIVVHRFDPQRYQGWQDRWLTGDAIRLGDSIARLGRYSARPIRLDDPALTEQRFNGRFRLDRPVESLTLIGALFDLSVRQDGETVRLVRNGGGRVGR